jgi:hypothetical protein
MFDYMSGIIKHTLLNQTRQEAVLKFYKVLAVSSLLHGGECWTLTQISSSQLKLLK